MWIYLFHEMFLIARDSTWCEIVSLFDHTVMKEPALTNIQRTE